MTDEAATVQAARALLARGRAGEAVALTADAAARPDAPHPVLAVHARALKVGGRHREALEFDRRAVERWPDSHVAWHNYGATLCDLGQPAEAQRAVERAFALGADAPESWLLLARALHLLGDLDGSEHAFEETLRRRPGFTDAAQELARLRWSRSQDPDAATAHFAAAAEAGADLGPLLRARAKMLESAGRREELLRFLHAALHTRPEDVGLWLAASQANLEAGDAEAAAALAGKAAQLAPRDPGPKVQLASALLAQGRAEDALAEARGALELQPWRQDALAWAATAARAAGDPLYRELYDYDAFVRAYDVETPAGWSDREQWLTDLAAELQALHVHHVQPFDQSLRLGSQTIDHLHKRQEPAVRSFFAAIDAPIRAYMQAVGPGDDPLRARAGRDWDLAGSWSVRLRPGGWHADHFHSEGWLSSAFYVRTPDAALDSQDRQGWIRFGRPPSPTIPDLPAEHHVRPKPGRLVLFPSYMWHGTVPFTTDEPRLTIAFDVVPA